MLRLEFRLRRAVHTDPKAWLRAPLVARQPQQRRCLHRVPPLPQDFVSNGVPGLLSKKGFDIAWTQYMAVLLERLNELTAGTDFDEREIKSILLTTSRDPSRAALFNHASMAHNTHFFFRGLAKSSQPSSSSSTEPNNGTDATPSAFSKNDNVPPPALLRALESSFSSLDTLRRELAATAMGMFGPGFVWVVRLGSGGDGGPGLYGSLGASGGGGGVPEFRILATYLAGTPYPQAHWRRQGGDMNTLPAGSGGDGGPFGASQQGYLGPWAGTAWTSTGRPLGAATGGAGSVSPPMAAPGMAAGGGLHQPGMWRRAAPGGVADLTPVLCLCTWEHVWLHDYGVGGKREFVENWWKTVDWEGVANMAGIRARREDVL